MRGGREHSPRESKHFRLTFKATDGIKKIFSALKIKDIETDVMAMIKRLMNNEGYTSKFSATQLIPSIYPHLSAASQQELMTMYSQVSQDDIP